jgi:hypothetical protein
MAGELAAAALRIDIIAGAQGASTAQASACRMAPVDRGEFGERRQPYRSEFGDFGGAAFEPRNNASGECRRNVLYMDNGKHSTR